MIKLIEYLSPTNLLPHNMHNLGARTCHILHHQKNNPVLETDVPITNEFGQLTRQ